MVIISSEFIHVFDTFILMVIHDLEPSQVARSYFFPMLFGFGCGASDEGTDLNVKLDNILNFFMYFDLK